MGKYVTLYERIHQIIFYVANAFIKHERVFAPLFTESFAQK
jgi:hypothetical protein